MASRTTTASSSARRMFIALLPDARLLGELTDLIDPLCVRWPQLRWSPSVNWHLTLAFLARVTPAEQYRLSAGLTDLAARSAGFGLRLAGAGAFPAPAIAHALWLGADEPTGALDRLAAGCRRAAGRAGLHADDKLFVPHLTLARSSQPSDLRLLVATLAESCSQPWYIDQIALVESQLGRGAAGGPRYLVRQRFALARH